jgi:hypothetical protein
MTETPQQKYKAKTIKQYPLQINRITENDIYLKMESEKNKQGYLKSLVRKDIKK